MNPLPSPTMPAVSATELVALITLAAMLVVTSYAELKNNRIPNWITLPGLLVGLLAGYLPGGITLGQSVVGFGVGFGFLFVFYMFGGMGGGDVKLMGAVGALMGYPMILSVLMFTALIGGAMGVAVLIWNQRALRSVLTHLNPFRRAPIEPTAEEAPKPSIPYGLAIIAGCLVTFFLFFLGA